MENNIMTIEDVKQGKGLTDDDWFNKMEDMGKKFYCPDCDEEFDMYSIERNEDGDKIWCLECDRLLFSV